MKGTSGSQAYTLFTTPLLNSGQKKHLSSACCVQAFVQETQMKNAQVSLGAAHMTLEQASNRENIRCVWERQWWEHRGGTLIPTTKG